MNELSAQGMMVDVEVRKKLNELIDLKDELEKEIKGSNPVKAQELKDGLNKVNDLIGKIRYHSLDEMNVLSEEKTDENNAEK